MISSRTNRFVPSSLWLSTALAVLLAWFLASPGSTEDSAANLPVARSEAIQELHGTLNGERFWARLSAPNREFGGHRVLQLLYTPPTPEELNGTVMIDHPDLLIDQHGRVRAWSERGFSGTAAEFRPDLKPPGYAITMERSREDNGHLIPTEEQRTIAAPQPTWDRRLAPVLFAFSWSVNNQATAVPVVTLFHTGENSNPGTIRWTGTTVDWAGTALTASADEHGRLQRLSAADGSHLIEISAWISAP